MGITVNISLPDQPQLQVIGRNSIKMFTIGFVTLVITTITSAATAKITFPIDRHEDLLQRGGLSEGEISEDMDVIFSEMTTTKDDATTRTGNIISFNSAACRDDEDWCDTPEEYPEYAIHDAVVKQKKIFKEMFQPGQSTTFNDSAIETQTQIARHSSLVGLRNGFLTEESATEEPEEEFTNICDLKTRYITPRAAKNKEGKFRFIVNHPDGDEEYTQLVRITQCSAAGEECGRGHLASAGVLTKCQQEYSDHKLVTLGESGEELIVDTFSFPSCCTCLISDTWSDK